MEVEPYAGVALAARLVVSIVFALSAASKITHLRTDNALLAHLGIKGTVNRSVMLSVGLTELAIAGVALPSSTSGVAGGAALMLLSWFTLVLLYAIATGRRVPCNCFGSLNREPAGGKAVVRNLLLLVPAAVLVALRNVDPWTVMSPLVLLEGGAYGAVFGGFLYLSNSVDPDLLRAMLRSRVGG